MTINFVNTCLLLALHTYHHVGPNRHSFLSPYTGIMILVTKTGYTEGFTFYHFKLLILIVKK